jgi:hypothetical protein
MSFKFKSFLGVWTVDLWSCLPFFKEDVLVLTLASCQLPIFLAGLQVVGVALDVKGNHAVELFLDVNIGRILP